MNKDTQLKSSCNFARLGIKKLLDELIEEKESDSSFYDDLEDENNSLPPLQDKLMCITFFQNDYANEFILNLIEENSLRPQSDYKVIVFTDFKNQEVLKRCIMSLYDSFIILDISMGLDELKKKISQFILKRKDTDFCQKTARKRKLSQREMTVLYYLLQGRCLSYVAESLGINYKTASGYKCSGMNKFGIRSLNSFFVQKNRINTFYDVYLSERK